MVKVKVRTISPEVSGNYNYVQITGYDMTNDRGFKKRVFAETRDGSPTAMAKKLNSLTSGDIVEITLDDSKYKNITDVKLLEKGASQSSGGNKGYSKGGGSKKGEFRTVAQLNREPALDMAIKVVMADGKAITAKKKEQIEGLAVRFENYLVAGSFDKKPEPVTDNKAESPRAPEEEPTTQNEPDPNDAPEPGFDPDSDIPF